MHPYTLLKRDGFWYVQGFEVGAGDVRTYRVDRIEDDVTVLRDEASVAPEGFDPGEAVNASIENIGAQGRPSEALVLVDADRAASAILELGEAAIVERRTDGSVVLRVSCRNPVLFRAWVLGFVEHAEVLEPAEVRAAGYAVSSARSDWQLGAAHGALLRRLAEESVAVARETDPSAAARHAEWLVQRTAQIEAGTLSLTVGHRDLLALPTAR